MRGGGGEHADQYASLISPFRYGFCSPKTPSVVGTTTIFFTHSKSPILTVPPFAHTSTSFPKLSSITLFIPSSDSPGAIAPNCTCPGLGVFVCTSRHASVSRVTFSLASLLSDRIALENPSSTNWKEMALYWR